MLFTDIEGSTLLLRDLGPAYADVLRDQRGIMRAAIDAHDGHEMGTEGDSFFVVFADAAAALGTAIDAQRGLHANVWPEGREVRVRMGLHIGDLDRHEEGYVGLDLNRAARIAGTAHGAQIVVSDAMAKAVGTSPGVDFRDLGLHRLKDLPEPVRIHQAVVAGLPDVTTPIKSLGAPTNVPAPRAPVLGRTAIEEQILGMLRGGERLVALIGPGGVGKTTLALALARVAATEFPSGIYFVALENATTLDQAWDAIAAALEAPRRDEMDSAETSTLEYLAATRSLVVLDNLEQLPAAGQLVVTLLERTNCAVVATSRGPLHVRGERTVIVPPLPPPRTDDTFAALQREPAVALFTREAQRARPSFELTTANAAAVAEICARVEGLPLAIELAASRVRTLGLDAIVRALDQHVAIASRDVDRPDRHRTISAMVAWSYELLDEDAKALFARLSVFVGGADPEDLLAVTGLPDALDGLDALADVSLVGIDETPTGEVRVTMLGLVRDVATERLESSGSADEARLSHAQRFVEFAEEATERIRTSDQRWSDKLALEHENLRAAFEWAIGTDGRHELAVRIAVALGWYWYTHGRGADGRRWLERAVAHASDVDPTLDARLNQNLGVLRQQQGDNDGAIASFSRALELARATADDSASARALNSLGIAHWAQDRADVALQLLTESVAIARSLGEEDRVSAALSNLGIVMLTSGDLDGAIAALSEALSIDRRAGDDWAIAVGQINLGTALVHKGEVQRGHALVVETFAAIRELDDPDLLASALEACAAASAHVDDPRRATRLVAAADRIREEARTPRIAAADVFLEREYGPARAQLERSEYLALVGDGRSRSVAEIIDIASEALDVAG